MPPSYPIIFFQAPDTKTLWQKSKNYGRDLGLKCVAYRDPRRRICLIDQLENMACDEFRRRRGSFILRSTAFQVFARFALYRESFGFLLTASLNAVQISPG